MSVLAGVCWGMASAALNEIERARTGTTWEDIQRRLKVFKSAKPRDKEKVLNYLINKRNITATKQDGVWHFIAALYQQNEETACIAMEENCTDDQQVELFDNGSVPVFKYNNNDQPVSDCTEDDQESKLNDIADNIAAMVTTMPGNVIPDLNDYVWWSQLDTFSKEWIGDILDSSHEITVADNKAYLRTAVNITPEIDHLIRETMYLIQQAMPSGLSVIEVTSFIRKHPSVCENTYDYILSTMEERGITVETRRDIGGLNCDYYLYTDGDQLEDPNKVENGRSTILPQHIHTGRASAPAKKPETTPIETKEVKVNNANENNNNAAITAAAVSMESSDCDVTKVAAMMRGMANMLEATHRDESAMRAWRARVKAAATEVAEAEANVAKAQAIATEKLGVLNRLIDELDM